MDRSVILIALRQLMPLHTGIQNPDNCFQCDSGVDRFVSWTVSGNMFLGKMFPDPIPALVAQAQHEHDYRGPCSCC